MQQRCSTSDAESLAKSLTGMSLGRQPFLVPYLPAAAMLCNIVLVTGSEDAKFVKMANHMAAVVEQQCKESERRLEPPHNDGISACTDTEASSIDDYITNIVVNNSGHAVHIERPEAILRLLSSC